MARKPVAQTLAQPQLSGFNLATLFQVGFIPLLTAIIILTGFYYVTGATLTRHDKQLDVLTSNVQSEVKARESVRNEYLASQQKINENLGKLDTRLAVSETKQEVANQTLTRIADELGKISTIAVKR